MGGKGGVESSETFFIGSGLGGICFRGDCPAAGDVRSSPHPEIAATGRRVPAFDIGVVDCVPGQHERVSPSQQMECRSTRARHNAATLRHDGAITSPGPGVCCVV